MTPSLGGFFQKASHEGKATKGEEGRRKEGTSNHKEKTTKWFSYHRSRSHNDADCRVLKENAAPSATHYAHKSAFPSNTAIGAHTHSLQPAAGGSTAPPCHMCQTSNKSENIATTGPTVHSGGLSFSALAPVTTSSSYHPAPTISLGRPLQPGVPPTGEG